MTRHTLAGRTGDDVTVPGAATDELDAALAGEVLLPGDDGYDEARTPWNGMIDRRPGLIARCRSADDVQRAVDFGRDHDLLVSVRGGGHHIAGNSVCDGGLMLDLSQMDAVEVDPDRRVARAGPGCDLADLDAATQAHGLATPTGINSTTGLAGLTLGGGFGWLTPKHGMTVDNLLSAEVVTADGRRLTASEEENPDLFWGLRGGSGNFGVVTSFEYRLHEVGPDVWTGLVVYPYDQADRVLRGWRDQVADAPDELVVWAVLRSAPPLPFLPEESHGDTVVVLAAFYAGDVEEGERLTAPLLELGDPVGQHLGPQPYAEWQQAFDPLLTPGARNYWKSHDFTELTDEALDVAAQGAESLPSPHCEVFLAQVGGEMARVAPDATAYPHRSSNFIMNVHGRWESPEDDDRCISWAREVFREMAPFATGGVYVNFLSQDETGRVRQAYGPNYDRLVEIKDRYDPQNLFRMNMNIPPSGA